MKILVIGGTGFLGQHLVEAAERTGHEITLFNRGRLKPDMFPHLENIRGDRERDLALLRDRHWDLVFDTCGYDPRVVRKSASTLQHAVSQYVFVSTISVYRDFSSPGISEEAPLAEFVDEKTEGVNHQTYGPLKALCERAIADVFPGGALIVRPGLLVGPHDPTERFVYWVRRVAEGGEILVAGPPGRPVQLMDVRDLAEWLVHAAEGEYVGVFNAVGPEYKLTMNDVISVCATNACVKPVVTWVRPDYLIEAGVAPWVELPLWAAPGWGGFVGIDARKAHSRGLRLRPLTDTVRDIFAWEKERPPDERHERLSRRREQELLRGWHRLTATEMGKS